MRCLLLTTLIIALIPVSVLGGSVVNSSHNLSSQLFLEEHAVNDYNEVCIYCHTPHNATSNVALWNRQLISETYFTPYTSSTLEATPGFPSESSRLCLSCHDGTIALDAIANIGSSPVEWLYLGTKTGHAKMNEQWCGPNCHLEGNSSYIYDTGRNLSDDHPVSIQYVESPDLMPKPADGVFPGSGGVKLVDGKVECVSCHNVHDPTISGRNFLRFRNSGSALCYICHNK